MPEATDRIHADDPELATRTEKVGDREVRIHYELEQGTPDWFYLRAGRLTASALSKLVTPKKLEPSIQAVTYALELAIERYREAPLSLDFRSKWGDRGIDEEAAARDWYELHNGCAVERVGFVEVVGFPAGFSPDGLVADDPEGPGGCEIKCRSPAEHMQTVLGWKDGASPAQIQGALYFSGRPWWDEVAYCYGLPGSIIRHRPDPRWQKALAETVPPFLAGVDRLVEQIEALGAIRRDGDLEGLLRRSLDLFKDPKKEDS